MPSYRLPLHVEARIARLLEEGAMAFGEAARDRYAALIVRAMQDVADDPHRPGSKVDHAVDPNVRFYHIRHSRARASPPGRRVGHPVHVLVYEIAEDGVVDILGVIPDRIPPEIAVRRFIPEL